MTRALALLLALLASAPAMAQQVPDPMTKGGVNVMGAGGSINLSASTVKPAFMQSPGSMADWPTGWWSRGWWGSRGGQNTQFLFGSLAAPVTTAGPPVSIGVVQGKTVATCDGISAQTGCNAALLVQNMGTAATTMVSSGLTAYVETKSTAGLGIGNAQAGNFEAVAASGSATGAMGIYAVGHRFTASSFAYGMELSAANEVATDCGVVNYTAISPCSILYMAPRGIGMISSAMQLILSGGSNPKVREGLVFNNNTVAEKTINDQSSSITSINIGGTHTTAIQTGIDAGRVLFGTNASYAGAFNVQHDYQFYGPDGVQIGLYANNALPPQLGFTKSNSNTIGAHVVVTAGTHLGQLSWSGSDGTGYQVGGMIMVTAVAPISTGILPGQMSFWVTDFAGVSNNRMMITPSGGLLLPALDTAGTIAGSLCRTNAGAVIYKAGANCF